VHVIATKAELLLSSVDGWFAHLAKLQHICMGSSRTDAHLTATVSTKHPLLQLLPSISRAGARSCGRVEYDSLIRLIRTNGMCLPQRDL
jgi:hypothetical protein